MKKLLLAISIVLMLSNALVAQSKNTKFLPNHHDFIFRVKDVPKLKEKIEKHRFKELFEDEAIKSIFKKLMDDEGEKITEEDLELLKEELNCLTGELLVTVKLPEKDSDPAIASSISDVDEDKATEVHEKEMEREEEKGDKATTKTDIYEFKGVKVYRQVPKKAIGSKSEKHTAILKNKLIISTERKTLERMIIAILDNKGLENNVQKYFEEKNLSVLSQKYDVYGYMNMNEFVNKKLAENPDPSAKKMSKAFRMTDIWEIDFGLNFTPERDVLDINWRIKSPIDGIFKMFATESTTFIAPNYIPNDITSYGHTNLSIPDIYNEAIRIMKAVVPNFNQTFEQGKQQAKMMANLDIDAFLKSFGNSTSTYSKIPENSSKIEDVVTVYTHELKSPTTFLMNLKNVLNSPMIQGMTKDLIEEVKINNQPFWKIKPSKNAAMSTGSVYGVMGNKLIYCQPPSVTQKVIKLLESPPAKGFKDSNDYLKYRELLPTKLSLYSITRLKKTLEAYKRIFSSGGIFEMLKDASPDFPWDEAKKVNLAPMPELLLMGAWRESNSFKIKIISIKE